MPMRRLVTAALMLLCASAAEAEPRLPDGRWKITLMGEGTHLLCYLTLSHVGEVRDGKPVYTGQAVFTYDVTPEGRMTASGSRKKDTASAEGEVNATRDEAKGTFRIPTRQCKGRWTARKLGP